MAPLMIFKWSELKFMVCIFWCNWIGLLFLQDGNLDNLSVKTISLLGIY